MRGKKELTLLDEFHKEEDIRRIDCLLKSLDFSPNEFVWDVLGRAISLHSLPLRSHAFKNSALFPQANDPTSISWEASNLSDPKWRYGLSRVDWYPL
ncbi:hypothetical protein TNCV_3828801 [Trichonephila clavipes]|nr:hypothetical protein TNCV_3828801 [Trichonephila clavipes]